MHDNWLNKQENILKEIDQLIKNINTKNRDLSKINESWEYNFPYILENIQNQLGWEKKPIGKKKILYKILKLLRLKNLYFRLLFQNDPIGLSNIWHDSNLKYDGSKKYNSVETVFGFRMDNEIWSVLTNGFYFQEISETLLFLRLLTKINYFVDVGANTGYYSLIAIHCSSNESLKVLSIEPHPEVFKKLKKTKLFESKNVSLIQSALSNFTGRGNLKEGKYGTGGSHIDNSDFTGDKSAGIFQINIKKFDEIEEIKLLSENGLIKIDTEGFEYEVLEGAKSFIKHNKPLIMIEVLPDKAKKFVKTLKYLERLDYFLYPIKRFPRQNEKIIEKKIKSINNYLNLYNVIAVHKDKIKILDSINKNIDLRIFNYPKHLSSLKNFLDLSISNKINN